MGRDRLRWLAGVYCRKPRGYLMTPEISAGKRQLMSMRESTGSLPGGRRGGSTQGTILPLR
jgi:hypothetical protein